LTITLRRSRISRDNNFAGSLRACILEDGDELGADVALHDAVGARSVRDQQIRVISGVLKSVQEGTQRGVDPYEIGFSVS